MLLSGNGGRGIGLLKETGLLAILLPEVDALDGVAQPARFHPEGDVLTHTRMLLDEYRSGGEVVALAALLHDIGKTPTATINDKGRIAFPGHAKVGAEMARAILERLRFSKKTTDKVETLIARHMDWPALPQMRQAKRRRMLLDDDLPLHMELHRLDCEACHRDTSIHAYALEEREKLLAEPPPIRPLLSGHELKRMGYEPGEAFGVMLEALVDAQLEGVVADEEQARAWLTERFAPPDGRSLAGGTAS